MRLSFVIPIYNVSKWLGRCIASIRNQGLAPDDYEIIAVNDGSTDESLQVLQDFLTREAQSGVSTAPVIVIDQPNRGLSAARNAGFARARGNYVWWVDSDDSLEACFAPRLLERAEKERLDVLCFGLNVINEADGSTRRYEIEDRTQGRTVRGEEFLLKCAMPSAAWAAIYRRGFIERYKLKYMEGVFHEDQEFTPRAYFLARRIAFENVAVYNYYQRESSIMNRKDPKKTTDLLTICQSLWDFAMEHTQIESAIRYTFINRVSYLFSQALSNLCRCGLNEFPGDYKALPYYPLSINHYLSKKERYKFHLINKSVPLYLKLYGKFVKPEKDNGNRKLRTHA